MVFEDRATHLPEMWVLLLLFVQVERTIDMGLRSRLLVILLVFVVTVAC